MAESQWHPSESVTGWSMNGQTWTLMRRADGVPALEGTTGCPSAGLVCWLLCMAVVTALIPACMWLLSDDWLPAAFVTLVCGLLCLLLLFSARQVIRVRRSLRGLESLSALAASKGLAVQIVDQLAISGTLRPAYVVNGVPMYDPSCLSSYPDLLRPADAPDPDELLRAAQDSPCGVADQLLRACGTESDDV